MTEEQKNAWRAYFVSLTNSITEWKFYAKEVATALQNDVTPPNPPENPPPPPNP